MVSRVNTGSALKLERTGRRLSDCVGEAERPWARVRGGRTVGGDELSRVSAGSRGKPRG